MKKKKDQKTKNKSAVKNKIKISVKKEKKYLSNVRVLKSQYTLRGDREMSEEEAKKFLQSYHSAMMKLKENKELQKEVQKRLKKKEVDVDVDEKNSLMKKETRKVDGKG